MTEELSKNAPSGEKGAQLAAELDQVDLSLKKAEFLVQYLRERKSVLLSDGVIYIERAKEQYDHHSKYDPQLSTSYQKLVKFFESRSASISEGIAKKKREAEEK